MYSKLQIISSFEARTFSVRIKELGGKFCLENLHNYSS